MANMTIGDLAKRFAVGASALGLTLATATGSPEAQGTAPPRSPSPPTPFELVELCKIPIPPKTDGTYITHLQVANIGIVPVVIVATNDGSIYACMPTGYTPKPYGITPGAPTKK